MTKTVRPLKQAIKDLKLPMGQASCYSSNTYNETYNWNKRGGHAGTKIIAKARQRAVELGWTEVIQQHNDATGDKVTNAGEYMNPERTVKMYANYHYGATAMDNRYTITLRLFL